MLPTDTSGGPDRTNAKPDDGAPAPGSDRLDVIIITGALGSGKTTLLRELLEQPQFSSAALLINEWGEVGIDHELVRGVVENVVLLESGCICCTIQGDLRSGLLDLAAQRALRVIDFQGPVIIETTGLASPVPLMQLFNSDAGIRHHFRLKGIVAVVDAVRFVEQSAELPDLVDQVCAADALYVAKTDLATAGHQGALSAALGSLNGWAVQFEAGTGGVTDLASWLTGDRAERKNAASRLPAPTKSPHLSGITSFVIQCDEPVAQRDFMSWIQLLLQSHGNCLLRMKGPVRFEDGTRLVQSAGPLFHPLSAWDGVETGTRLVCIVRGLDAAAIRESFLAVTGRRRMARPTLPCHETEAIELSPGLAAKLARALEPVMRSDVSPAILWNLHNPWSVAGRHIDSWPLLDFCEDPDVLAAARAEIGQDIALIETEFLFTSAADADDASTRKGLATPPLPVVPAAGTELRFHVPWSDGKGARDSGRWTMSVATLGAPVPLEGAEQAVFVIRYMPTSSSFVRDGTFAANIERKRLAPLANVAAAPIWLVSGTDHAGNNYAHGFDQVRAEWLSA